ncbi:MAG: hypothetical protein M0Z65_09230 [Firmicutes bacterium]|uniref:Uncharacterized protein n=1 Tax=Melghirimyces thermohalophilus TaxID=1236220 RepID=A0A1G6MVA5_9BACL|nr:hypothetical protein [Melghirimyces thermohalophilus]MDA8353344.1 hypothetical protein [Bacillota bacterium]SDC59490.1 hypothetical protein SAMN04488112_1115 [Melghirimyces thermohalophilus]
MDVKKEFQQALEKAHMYGLLAEYYKYQDAELYMYYHRKHCVCTQKVAGMAQEMSRKQVAAGEGTSESPYAGP